MEAEQKVNQRAAQGRCSSSSSNPAKGPSPPPKLSSEAHRAWQIWKDIGEKTTQEIRHQLEQKESAESLAGEDGFGEHDTRADARVVFKMNERFAEGPYSGILDSVLDAVGNTPMIRMKRLAKAYGLECDLLAKCEFLSAGGSVKDRIGKAMVEKAEREGRLKAGDTLIEPTSGNTGIGLALAAAVRGYRMIVTMPAKMSSEKSNLMKCLGAEIIRTPTEAAWNDETSHMGVAAKLQKELENAHILDQYNNSANPMVHYDVTAEEVLTQCGGDIDMIVIGAGTGGTITGVGKKIKEKCPKCKVIGVDPKGSILAVPDCLNDEKRLLPYQVEGIGYDFVPGVLDRDVVDAWVKVGDAESFATAREIIRNEGLFVGGSSGANVWGALQAARKLKEGQKCVVLLPDSSRNYMSKFISDEWMAENGFAPEDGAKVKEREAQFGDARIRDWLAEMRARSDVPFVTAGHSVEKVVKVMHETKVKEVIITEDCETDGKKKPVGVLSEDHIDHSLQSRRCTMQSPVKDIAFKKLAKAFPSTYLRDIAKALDSSPYVCVMDEKPSEKRAVDGEQGGQSGRENSMDSEECPPCLGVITRIDLLHWLATKQK
ncbi:Protein ZC373.1, partially confirmed by transcript evidence, related [Neospora caninum Liverpool]|uniref:Cystathionine beta-synthase n=1 Tax=Neospora caninum (strain Liverpool) TaxID=572307 RepID=F0VGV2_NEOCL